MGMTCAGQVTRCVWDGWRCEGMICGGEGVDGGMECGVCGEWSTKLKRTVCTCQRLPRLDMVYAEGGMVQTSSLRVVHNQKLARLDLLNK